MTLVNEFLSVCPEVRVDIDFSSRAVNILEEGYDAAIHAGPVTNMSVVAHKLMDSPFSIVASPSYVRRRGKPRQASDLLEHDCIVFGASSVNARWTLGTTSEPIEVSVRGRVATNHLHAVRDAALAGHGIALLPRLACQSELAAGRLCAVLPELSPSPVPLYITYPAGRYLPAATRAFVDFVKANFRRVAESVPKAKAARSRRKERAS